MPTSRALNQQIGKLIAEQRRIKGLTQQELADRLSIGAEALSRLELGKNQLSVPRLFQIADALNCSLAELMNAVSTRPSDMVEQLNGLLHELSDQDRQYLLSSTKSLAEHLRSR